MNQHPYLRAYMAGIVAPTLFLLVGLTVFCIARFVYNVPAPIERLIVFPMAVIPNAFGLWNMLYLRLRHWQTPIGMHGALLPFFLAPTGFVLATLMGFLKLSNTGFVYFEIIRVPYWFLAVALPATLALYYLIWKYVVGALNRVVDLPC
jgi:hypothetical protein